MSGEGKPGQPPDPFTLFRQLYSANEEAFSKAMNQFVNTETYAASMGKYMENAMATQKTIQEQMESYLHSNNLPTRKDFTRLASQIVNIDERLDDLQMYLEDHQGSAELQKLHGQVNALEVRLSHIEGVLEQILKAMNIVAAQHEAKPASDTKTAAEEKSYPLGEASPTDKKPARRKTTAQPEN